MNQAAIEYFQESFPDANWKEAWENFAHDHDFPFADYLQDHNVPGNLANALEVGAKQQWGEMD